ncbi:MAG TPA: hypothetical protein PLK90_09290 [Clostridiales bacterium]|nr:hypothetical protein [Clostridiales bacterium]HQP70580.1 hypothetical protein [Clostridiales bacterium]
MKELRVYFECLEQAAHFIKPLVEKTEAFKSGNINLQLIKLIGSHRVYSKQVAPVVYLKDPDILFTIIEDGNEIPLFQLEISTAVFTEDHELQRFDGIVSSVENNCIYGKLSPLNKKSQSKHGGNTNFDFRISYAAIMQKYGKLSLHFDWPCDEKGNVLVNSEYLSCPERVNSLEYFVDELLKFSLQYNFSKENWLKYFDKQLMKLKSVREWHDEISKVIIPDITKQNTTRTEWKPDESRFHLKLNRFGHAMDPERGMLAFYGTISEVVVAKMLFDEKNKSWYKDTPKEDEITEYIENTSLEVAYNYLNCFMLGSGLYSNSDFKNIVKKYSKNNSETIEIDLTKFLNKHFDNLNKPLRTLFKFAKEFQIIDTEGAIKVKLLWGKIKPKMDFSKNPPVTPLHERKLFDEDDITYISVHNVLKQNGYKIVGVSYPGAQGDRVVLAEKENGRKQKRRYIDIISYLPESHSSLQENKGKFSKKSLQSEINELSKYKSDTNYIKAINTFFELFDNKAPKLLKIGVGFWANAKFQVEHIQGLNIDDLDYFIYITNDQKLWKVFNTGDKQLFTKTTGNVELPPIFEIGATEEEIPNLFSTKE